MQLISGFKLKILVGLSALGSIWLAVLLIDSWQAVAELERELARLERERAELLESNEKISQQLEQLQDPVFIEREARQTFNYQKEDEKAVIFIEPPEATPAEVPEQGGFFTKIRNWFKLLFK